MGRTTDVVEESDDRTLPGRLLNLRKERELSQRELARKAGIPFNSYCNWERGHNEPTLANLKRLANFFGVSIDYLLGETDIKKPYPHPPDDHPQEA